jgi:hypothetical protein
MACYYTLSFSVEFKHAKDTVLIAYSYPYTFTDYKVYLRDTLARLNLSRGHSHAQSHGDAKNKTQDILRVSKLCTTIGGEICDLWAITDYTTDKDRIGPIAVHPLVDGQLITESQLAQYNHSAASSNGHHSSGGWGGSNGGSVSMSSQSEGRHKGARLKPALFISGQKYIGFIRGITVELCRTGPSWRNTSFLDDERKSRFSHF